MQITLDFGQYYRSRLPPAVCWLFFFLCCSQSDQHSFSRSCTFACCLLDGNELSDGFFYTQIHDNTAMQWVSRTQVPYSLENETKIILYFVFPCSEWLFNINHTPSTNHSVWKLDRLDRHKLIGYGSMFFSVTLVNSFSFVSIQFGWHSIGHSIRLLWVVSAVTTSPEKCLFTKLDEFPCFQQQNTQIISGIERFDYWSECNWFNVTFWDFLSSQRTVENDSGETKCLQMRINYFTSAMHVFEIPFEFSYVQLMNMNWCYSNANNSECELNKVLLTSLLHWNAIHWLKSFIKN